MHARRTGKRAVLSAAPPIITLISDFGAKDSYVAEMKAVLLRYAPQAILVDVTHELSPQDVVAGSIVLERVLRAFGPGTVHLAVVDPGVGTDRKILIVDIADQRVVCPDNGLITWAWRRLGAGQAYALPIPVGQISRTFHGRDIFAPAAARLAAGVAITQLAAAKTRPILLDLHVAGTAAVSCPSAALGEQPEGRAAILQKPRPVRKPPSTAIHSRTARRAGNPRAVDCRIIYIDSFGNAITNLPQEAIASNAPSVTVGNRSIGPIRQTYADVKSGHPLALFGSSGLLEIAVRDSSAARKLRLQVGQGVQLRFPREKKRS